MGYQQLKTVTLNLNLGSKDRTKKRRNRTLKKITLKRADKGEKQKSRKETKSSEKKRDPKRKHHITQDLSKLRITEEESN